MMRRLHAALCGALLLLAAPVWAQSPKTTLNSQVQQQFPDNATGAITPATTRTFLSSVINSFQQYAGVNAQTGTAYTVQASDYGQLLTFANAGAVTVSIPAASTFGTFNFYAVNIGVSSVNLVPVTGTIDGSTNLALSGSQGVWVVSDGTNYKTWRGFGTGTVSSIAMTVPGCLAVSGSPVTITGTLAVTANGTSGGIPYFNGTTTCASSAQLPLNAVVLGGGAGGAPTAGAAPTAAQIFLGQASGPPLWQTQSGDVTFGATGVSAIGANKVTNSQLATMATSTLKGNATGGTAAPTDVTLGATLAFSGTALQTTAHTGDVTSPSNSNAMTIGTNAVTNAKAAQAAANTVKGNFTAGTANDADNAVPSCSGANQALNYTSGTGLACVTISAGTSKGYAYGSSQGASIGPSTTQYSGLASQFSGSEPGTQSVVPLSGTFKNLFVTLSADPGTGITVVFTIRKNAASQTVTCTITGNGSTGKTCNDTTHSFTVAAGDLIDLQDVAGALSTSPILGWSAEYDNP